VDEENVIKIYTNTKNMQKNKAPLIDFLSLNLKSLLPFFKQFQN